MRGMGWIEEDPSRGCWLAEGGEIDIGTQRRCGKVSRQADLLLAGTVEFNGLEWIAAAKRVQVHTAGVL
jgi:hypothetical protein